MVGNIFEANAAAPPIANTNAPTPKPRAPIAITNLGANKAALPIPAISPPMAVPIPAPIPPIARAIPAKIPPA